MALPPPLDSGGDGKRWVHRATGAVLPINPEEGSESLLRDKQRDRVALWTRQSGAQFPPCRDPPLSPTSPAPPCHLAGTSQQKQTHLNPPP